MPQKNRSSKPLAKIAQFPDTPGVRFRRRLGEAHTYADIFELAHDAITHVERQEKAAAARNRARDASQLAFPWEDSASAGS